MILARCRNLGLSGEAGRVSIQDSGRRMTRCGILKLQWNEEELHMDGCGQHKKIIALVEVDSISKYNGDYSDKVS